jgi:hypothetical protein
VTDTLASDAATGEILRAILRRAGHELRNAQNAAAVNLEALRSKASRGGDQQAALLPFAENAARGLEESVAIAEATIGLCTGVLHALLAANISGMAPDAKGNSRLDLRMSGAEAARLASRVTPAAERLGVVVEPREAGVILTVLKPNEAN